MFTGDIKRGNWRLTLIIRITWFDTKERCNGDMSRLNVNVI